MKAKKVELAGMKRAADRAASRLAEFEEFLADCATVHEVTRRDRSGETAFEVPSEGGNDLAAPHIVSERVREGRDVRVVEGVLIGTRADGSKVRYHAGGEWIGGRVTVDRVHDHLKHEADYWRCLIEETERGIAEGAIEDCGATA